MGGSISQIQSNIGGLIFSPYLWAFRHLGFPPMTERPSVFDPESPWAAPKRRQREPRASNPLGKRKQGWVALS